MKKMIICLMALLLAITPMTSYAKDYKGDADWYVTFNGKKMDSSFKSSDIDDLVLGIQPGDTMEMHIALLNEHSESTDWYLANEVLKSLEDTRGSKGGAYSYILSYIDKSGKKTDIFNSDVVGGESTEGGIGLHQATNALKDYFYLDTLAPDQNGEIVLIVKLEGETQGNSYQDTLAKLEMKFAVELTSVPNSKKIIKRVPRTGDTANLVLYSTIALGAGLICLLLLVFKLRSDKRREERQARRGGRR